MSIIYILKNIREIIRLLDKFAGWIDCGTYQIQKSAEILGPRY